jgi:hypothetical protein
LERHTVEMESLGKVEAEQKALINKLSSIEWLIIITLTILQLCNWRQA